MEVKKKFAMGNARNVAIYQSEFVKVYFTCRAGMM